MTAADPLIDAEALAGELAGATPPTVLDVRWALGGPPGIEAYRAGHVPGAVYVDLDQDLAGAPGPAGRHPLPDPVAFERSMRALGVDDDRPVVVYDDSGGLVAARAWWNLAYFGHRDVRLLDGGLAAWVAAGQPVAEGDQPRPAAGRFTARPGGLALVDADGAARLAAAGRLLDARAPERFRGEVEPVDPVAGHVPGALSAPTTANLDPSGRFLAPEVLRARFAGLGVVGGEPVGAYCGSGVNAAHEVLALRLAGYEPALFVGSWSSWVADGTRPVAVGEGSTSGSREPT